MPKRWKVVAGGSYTWQYVDTDERPAKVLAQSNESWETKKEVRDEIAEMKANEDFDEDDS